ncbi:MAG: Gx transporter family protein [Tissierellia bacterium]|nr:Gx transporter family protein [Tissierellia bacterium]
MEYQDKITTKKLLHIALFSSIALVLSYLERFIFLPLPIPGLKLGIANIAVLSCMITIDFKSAAVVAIIKSLLSVFLFSKGSALLYSLPATIVSLFVMGFIIFKTGDRFSEVGASVLGSVSFNMTQIIIAANIIRDFSLLYILPYMNILSVFTGVFIGYASKFLKEAIYKRGIL